MAHPPQLVTQILEAGAHVDLSNVHSGFSPEDVTAWAQLAAAKGGHLTVGVGYEHARYAEWARIAGPHLTVKL